jgi:NTP pyrophosphatase (non-canonical NTP hydrolase)
MTIAEYEEVVNKTAKYPGRGRDLIYPVLGLCGESGEVAEKVKKIIRDQSGVIDDNNRAAIKLELSDVLWYLTAIAQELDSGLEEIMDINAKKLLSRLERGVLGGSGDNR